MDLSTAEAQRTPRFRREKRREREIDSLLPLSSPLHHLSAKPCRFLRCLRRLEEDLPTVNCFFKQSTQSAAIPTYCPAEGCVGSTGSDLPWSCAFSSNSSCSRSIRSYSARRSSSVLTLSRLRIMSSR